MPIYLEWYNEQHTILHQTYQDTWSAAEFRQAAQDNFEMQATVSHPVDVIADFTASKPGSILISSLGGQAEALLPPNQRLVIVVGASAITKAFMEVARRFAPKSMANVRTVSTLAQAHALIQRNQSPDA